MRIEYKESAVYSNGGFLCLGRVWYGARDGSTAIPPVVARIFSGDSTSPLTREASAIVLFEGLCGKGGHGEVTWVLLKHYCFTTGHHFDEC